MKVTDIFKSIEAFVSSIESTYADRRGIKAKNELKSKYPLGLHGKVSKVYMTRGKRKNRMLFNPSSKGVISDLYFRRKYHDCYEVVYHARLGNHKDFVLSLFHAELDSYVGKEITIKEFGCVRHFLHFLFIGHVRIWPFNIGYTSTEVYPQEVVVHDVCR